MKSRVRETPITAEQAGPLREYVKLMNELDEAQKVSTKGTHEQRKAAFANIKEIASFVAENKKDLRESGLKVESLGLDRKDNRKLFMRDRKDIFAPSANVFLSGKQKEAPTMNYDLSEDDLEASAEYVNRQIADKESDLMEKFYGDDFKAAPDLNAEPVGYAEPRPLARVNRGPDGRVIRKTIVDMRPVDQRPEDGPMKLAPDVIDPNSPKRKQERADADRDAEYTRLNGLTAAQGYEEGFLGKNFGNTGTSDVPAPQPKSAWGRAKSWMSGTAVGKTAKWLGVGIIGVLGMSVLGPRQDVEDRPQAEQSAMMAPVQEVLPAANVSVDDENVLINAAEEVGETVSDSAATKETKAAVREFRKSGDSRNLEDALKNLEILQGKDAYLQEQAEARKADLQARLADLAVIRSVMSSKSPAVEASKRIDMEKRIAKAKARSEDMISYLELMRTIRSQ